MMCHIDGVLKKQKFIFNPFNIEILYITENCIYIYYNLLIPLCYAHSLVNL